MVNPVIDLDVLREPVVASKARVQQKAPDSIWCKGFPPSFEAFEVNDLHSANPYTQSSNFVGLLNSQQESVHYEPFPFVDPVSLFSTQATGASTYGAREDREDLSAERRERKKWTPTDDMLLISSWLNTSKDPIVGNKQKSVAFWKRIAAYMAACPKAEGREFREAGQCKQRWHKINDLVCKFCGSYEAASREKASGQNENDVLKLAHELFYNDHKKRFTLEHAWKELRNDQK
ncbi:glutathione S-transferase T3-like [Eutrema salsugineum]|uniref:glutathione S-transferase T3-like n=1 Tax=Eutrema salsugineum TaxID=72664 RepID=UPI000CED709C|nr:glutathione S-transferase T3-like [Eutrema salsugineum]